MLMAINGFQSRYKGDVVLSKRSRHCCSKAEVDLKSLGTGDLQACAAFLLCTHISTNTSSTTLCFITCYELSSTLFLTHCNEMAMLRYNVSI